MAEHFLSGYLCTQNKKAFRAVLRPEGGQMRGAPAIVPQVGQGSMLFTPVPIYYLGELSAPLIRPLTGPR